MPLNPNIFRFIQEHLDDNPDQLLWKKNDYPDNRVVIAVEQIQARENIKDKLPSWYACRDRTMFFRNNSSLQVTTCHGGLSL